MSNLASSLSLSNTHAETHLWQCLHFHKGSWEIPSVFHSSGTQSYVNLETDSPSCHSRMEIFDGCVDFKPVSSFILGRQPFPTPTPKTFPILLFELAISGPSWPRKLNYLKVRLDKIRCDWQAGVSPVGGSIVNLGASQFLSSSPVYFPLSVILWSISVVKCHVGWVSE